MKKPILTTMWHLIQATTFSLNSTSAFKMPRLNLGIKDPNERIDDVLPYSADVTRIIYSTLKQKKALVFGNKDNGIVILSHS